MGGVHTHGYARHTAGLPHRQTPQTAAAARTNGRGESRREAARASAKTRASRRRRRDRWTSATPSIARRRARPPRGKRGDGGGGTPAGPGAGLFWASALRNTDSIPFQSAGSRTPFDSPRPGPRRFTAAPRRLSCTACAPGADDGRPRPWRITGAASERCKHLRTPATC